LGQKQPRLWPRGEADGKPAIVDREERQIHRRELSAFYHFGRKTLVADVSGRDDEPAAEVAAVARGVGAFDDMDGVEFEGLVRRSG
jgi:hypothetical protein